MSAGMLTAARQTACALLEWPSKIPTQLRRAVRQKTAVNAVALKQVNTTDAGAAAAKRLHCGLVALLGSRSKTQPLDASIHDESGELLLYSTGFNIGRLYALFLRPVVFTGRHHCSESAGEGRADVGP